MYNGINYTNNTQYNYTNNFPNQSYFSQQNQINIDTLYRSNSNLTNNANDSNKNNLSDYNCNQPASRKKKPGNKKKVTFNEHVIIINVDSYKEYNKIYDDINIDTLFNNDFNNKPNIVINKKKDKCECI